MKYSGSDFLPLARLKSLEFTRRTFLIGSATASAAPAFAASTSNEHRLTFHWNQDKTILTIRQDIREVSDPGGKTESFKPWIKGEGGTWILPRSAFGPNAEFGLRSANGTDFQLHVRNAEFGRIRDRVIRFDFTSENRGPYHVSLLTSIWSLSSGPGDVQGFTLGKRPPKSKSRLERETSPVPFSDFTDPTKKEADLFQWVANGRISSTFQLIFNGLVDTRATDTQHGVYLSFSPDCVWTVEAYVSPRDRTVELTTLGGAVSLSRIDFAWCESLESHDRLPTRGEDGTAAQENAARANGAVLLATGAISLASGQVSVASNGHEMVLEQVETGRNEPIAFWARTGHQPEHRPRLKQRSRQIETEVALVGAWKYALKSRIAEKGGAEEQFTIGQTLWGVVRSRLALDRSYTQNLKPENLLTEVVFDGDFKVDKVKPQSAEGRGEAQEQSGRPLTTRAMRSETPVGPLVVAGELPENLALAAEGQTSRAVAAFAPRDGAAVRTVFSRREPGEGFHLRWAEANFLLLECFRRLEGADFSRLTFEPTSLIVLFSEDQTPPRGYRSFISLNGNGTGPRAQIDLDRAKLTAGNAGNLLHLTFRFSRMALALSDATATIAPVADVCRVTGLDPVADAGSFSAREHKDTELLYSSAQPDKPETGAGRMMERDDRALLIVDFPPQHLLEEAFFRTDPGTPPAMVFADPDKAKMTWGDEREFDLTDPLSILEALDWPVVEGGREKPTAQQRKLRREAILEHYKKYQENAGSRPEFVAFNNMREEFRNSAEKLLGAPNRLPVDQTIYIGPFGLDADAAGVMRRVWTGLFKDQLNNILTELFSQARDAARNVLASAEKRKNDKKMRPNDLTLLEHEKDLDGALALEVAVEGARPGYQLFRTFYREAMVDLFLSQGHAGLEPGPLKEAAKKLNKTELDRLIPKTLHVAETEFVNPLPNFKTPTNLGWAAAFDGKGILRERCNLVWQAYKLELSGNEPLPHLVEGRLSNPSRLAFHVNCRDRQSWLRAGVPELDPEIDATAIDASDTGEEDRYLTDKRRFGVFALEFSLEDLTRWSAFEMSVTRRARRLVSPDIAGRLDMFSGRQNNDGGGAMLDALGFPAGMHLSSAEWNAHLIETLREPPTPLETAIEIPARLTLSPDQNAVFLAPQPLPEHMRPGDGMHKLWAARLSQDDGKAGIRAVHSPDLRPQVFARKYKNNVGGKTVPGFLPPPRGPNAPWFLDRHDTGSEAPNAYEFAKEYLKEGEYDGKEAELCKAILARQTEGEQRLPLPWLVDRLCARLNRRKNARNALKFRSSLDAAIRHELVLLSSAYGMRSVARANRQGHLLGDSQFVADPRHRLYDLEPGEAIFKPQAFDVSELELTSLGGSYRAQAGFEPPAGAKTLDDVPNFPALSIERYQHWAVLGRDIFVEVVFKGFLLPFGHRASLVQVTERRFELDKNGNIACYLIQRMYIQRGVKTVRFPGLGQPVEGRMCPFAQASILTERSPDIVDPYDGAKRENKVSSAGRLGFKDDMPGVAFWPRTAKSDAANVRFELQLDQHFCTLPLLFVDNTAANDPETLRFIVEYYNSQISSPHSERNGAFDPAVHLSTLSLGGAKLRYAEEEKAGSCSLETESLTLFLTGQENGGSEIKGRKAIDTPLNEAVEVEWIRFQNNGFDFSPVLQGADRLPAYPAMHTARVYLRQNERLTGQENDPVRVKYDGRYLSSGLPGRENRTASPAPAAPSGNRSEIVLSFLDHPLQAMGAKGEKAGGVVRPDTHLVAFSRQSGPVGIGKKSIAGTTRLKLPPGLEKNQFHNTADLFDAPVPAAAPSGRGAAPGAARPLVLAAARSSVGDGTLNDIKRLYERYFSNDSKLLGLISIRELIQIVVELNGDPALLDPKTGLPKLVQLIKYGGGQAAAAAQKAAGSAQAGIDFVRSEIVEPLDETLVDILAEWAKADARIRAEQQQLGDLIDAVSLDQLLPGLHAALVELQTATRSALQETDEILFTLTLGTAYEAGRRLVDTIGRILAEIDEIVAEAVGRQVRSFVKFVSPLIEGFDNLARYSAEELLTQVLKPVVSNDEMARKLAQAIISGEDDDEIKKHLAEMGATWVAELILPGSEEKFEYFPIPPVNDFTEPPDLAPHLIKCLSPSNKEVRDLLQPLLEEMMLLVFDGSEDPVNEAIDNTNLKSKLITLQAGKIDKVLDAWVRDKEIEGKKFSKPLQKNIVPQRLNQYRRIIASPEISLDLAQEAGAKVEDILRHAFQDEVRFVELARLHLGNARKALRRGNFSDTATQTKSFVELFAGPFELDLEKLKDHWGQVLTWLSDAIDTTDYTPCPLVDHPADVCTYDETDGISATYTPKGNGLCTKIFGVFGVLKELDIPLGNAREKLKEFLDDDALDDVLGDRAELLRNKLANTLLEVSSAHKTLKNAAGNTYCDFVNDAIAAKAFNDDLRNTLAQLATAGDAKSVAKILASLPPKFELLLRFRQRMAETLALRIKETGVALQELFENEVFVSLLAAGGLVAYLESSVGAEDTEKIKAEAEIIVEEFEKEFASTKSYIERVTHKSAEIIQKYLVSLKGINQLLIDFSEDKIEKINKKIYPVQINAGESVQRLREIQDYLTAVLSLIDDKLKPPPNDLMDFSELQSLAAELKGKKIPILEFVAPTTSVDEDYVKELRLLQAQVERIGDELIAQARDVLRRTQEQALKQLDKPAGQLLSLELPYPVEGANDSSLAGIYAFLTEKRNSWHTRIAVNPAGNVVAARLLVTPIDQTRIAVNGFSADPNNPLHDRMAADSALLNHVKAAPVSIDANRAYLMQFFAEWGEGRSAPMLIGQQMLDTLRDLLRGDVLKLIPLREIRDQIEDRILEMVPSEISQSFSFGTALPSAIENMTLGIFKPGTDSKLKIGMKVDVDLFPDRISGALAGSKPSVEFRSFGELGPFDIKLVGSFLDALTLHFGSARFEMQTGQQKRFNVEFRDFTIGRDLQFVQALADMLSPGGSGPYIVPARGFPGVEAGYGLNIGTFMIGNMSFFNVSLNAAAILPFDDNPTRFRASLSRRDAPFTLSYAPYGGSGFFAIEADASGIVGFEASFEFGGAAAFAIGPLTGQGRLMAGFYIRQTRVDGRRLTEMAATVFVGGSANIWIFSFGASLYVRLGMTNGNMTGLAIFTYSFSIGIKDFDFSIEWRKKEKEGFNGESAFLPGFQRPTRFAGSGAARGVSIKRETVCQSQNWQTYSTYFDRELTQGSYLDANF